MVGGDSLGGEDDAGADPKLHVESAKYSVRISEEECGANAAWLKDAETMMILNDICHRPSQGAGECVNYGDDCIGFMLEREDPSVSLS
jgi:hypothetical protein